MKYQVSFSWLTCYFHIHIKRSALLSLHKKSHLVQWCLWQQCLCQSNFDATSKWQTIYLRTGIQILLDVDELTAQPENKNTKKKMMYDMNIVLKFLREVQNKERKLENIPPEEVNIYLSEFIISARTKKGEWYEPSSLRGILSRVDFYLTRGEYEKRLFTDPEFMRFGDTLKAMQKEQKKQGAHSWNIFSTQREISYLCTAM